MVTSVASSRDSDFTPAGSLIVGQMQRMADFQRADIGLDVLRNIVDRAFEIDGVGDDVDGAAALDAGRGFRRSRRAAGTLTRMVAPSPSRMKSTCSGKSRTGSRWKSRGITRCFLPSRSMS